MTGFTAYALSGELDLNRLAADLGFPRRYRWEEPMVLDVAGLTPLSGDQGEGKRVYLYYFGGVVFVNCSEEEIGAFSRSMERYADQFREYPSIRYRDDYSLRTGEGDRIAVTNDSAVMPGYDPAYVDIICFVVAKSVALERIEERVDLVLDEMEELIALLDRGKLELSDRRLATLASSILTYKYQSIAHIMVLDKPDITWENPEADRLYLTMANLFELNQRYNEIRHKGETLLDITQVFTSLSHARRATRLEWIIIVLIFIEIVIYLFEILRRG
ncbi:RMD1 family protein [Geobacter sp.]|uniref:RMD1 family protein n=1 Tax=Geobacter sp. TaxID=46610 RepID=UPI0026278D5C|nr:RMD1 family protein [Geobacter sp.]